MYYTVGFGGNKLISRIRGEKHIREILERVEKEDESKKSRFQANLEVVVWGSTYAEAKINYYFEHVIKGITKEGHKDLLWDINRSKRVGKKIEVIQQVLDIEDEPIDAIEDVLKGNTKHIRNKIIHYKEKFSKLEVPKDWLSREVDVDEDADVVERTKKLLHPGKGDGPTPDIEKRLLSKEFDERRAEILDKVDRFSDAVEYYLFE